MLAIESTEQSSNWDFTAVHDFLRSSAYGSRVSIADVSRPTVLSPTGGQSGQNVDNAGIPAAESTAQQGYSRLGDFGPLWDLLNRDLKENIEQDSTNAILHASEVDEHTQRPVPACTTPTRCGLHLSAPSDTVFMPSRSSFRTAPFSSASKPEISNDTIRGHPSGSTNQPRAFTTLKRAARSSGGIQTSNVTSTPQRPSSKSTIDASHPIDTPKTIAKAKPRGNRNPQHKNGVLESSTDADSDSDTVIFDRGFTQSARRLAFVPTQVGTLDARAGHYETPPSSYDEDSSLNDDAIRNVITTPAGIQVLPAAYKTLTERRTGLMTKLLKDFPGFTQFVSQVGGLAPQKMGVEHRPIHVFVDMSNVFVDSFNSMFWPG